MTCYTMTVENPESRGPNTQFPVSLKVLMNKERILIDFIAIVWDNAGFCIRGSLEDKLSSFLRSAH